MRLVHESADGRRSVLATEVETADSALAKTRGLMFRGSLPSAYAMVFPFDDAGGLSSRLPSWATDRLPWAGRHGYRSIHMLFVRLPLDVLWLDDGEVVETATLRPWLGTGGARADTVIELPAGAADGVDVGDCVFLEEANETTDPTGSHAPAGEPDADEASAAAETADTATGTEPETDGGGEEAGE